MASLLASVWSHRLHGVCSYDYCENRAKIRCSEMALHDCMDRNEFRVSTINPLPYRREFGDGMPTFGLPRVPSSDRLKPGYSLRHRHKSFRR